MKNYIDKLESIIKNTYDEINIDGLDVFYNKKTFFTQCGDKIGLYINKQKFCRYDAYTNKNDEIVCDIVSDLNNSIYFNDDLKLWISYEEVIKGIENTKNKYIELEKLENEKIRQQFLKNK